jgi:alpha-D-ribose 1-methylphosphonate 5-triphosphate diphosphatase PhnM
VYKFISCNLAVLIYYCSTFKQECHAKIRFGLTEDGQHLTVKEINEEHNHMVSRSTFDHLPRQRKFDELTKQEAALLLDLKANKKMVQEHLQVYWHITLT